MGGRGRHSHPGAHHHQPPQRERSRQSVRHVREATHRDVECVLPGSGGTRAAGRFAERRRVRAGVWEDLRTLAPRQLSDQDHGGDALPPLSAAAQPGREEDGARTRPSAGSGLRGRRTYGRRPNARHELGDAPRERRQGIRLHLAHGQRVSQRIPAHPRGQHSRDAARRDLPQRADLQGAARHQASGRQVRGVRV